MSSPPLRPWGPPAFLFCFAAKGMRPLGEPVVFDFGGSAPGGSLCGAGGPYAPLCRRSALHPGRVYAGLVAPAAPDLGAPPQVPRGVCAGLVAPASHYAGAPPQTPGDFRFTTKVTKGVSGGAPLNSRGGHYHPPSGVAAPPRRTLPLGVGGGVGLCFPPRRIGVSGCRYPFLYSEKKLLRARWGAQAVHSR